MSALIATVTALVALVVTLLGALITVIWRGGSLVTELKIAIADLKVGLAEVRQGLESLQEIPLLRQRVEQHDRILTEHSAKVADLWKKVFSFDKHVAVARERARSRPDIQEEEDT